MVAAIAVFVAAAIDCRAEDWAAGFKTLQTNGGNFRMQLDYARKWVQAEPNNPAAWTIVGANSDALGNYAQGADGWHHVAELSPTLVWPLQNLANDYEHLGRPAEAAAIYRKLLTMKHDAALDAGWRHRLGELDLVTSADVSVPMAGHLPSGIPEAAHQLTTTIRRKWRSDAILNLILVRPEGTSFRTEFKFFSPSSNSGMTITVRGSRVSARDETDPERERTSLPSNLIDLPEAVSKARTCATRDDISRATLYCRTRCMADGTGALWSLTARNRRSGVEETFEVAAFVISNQEFQTLVRNAERGDAHAQLAVARAYFEGLTGSPDTAQAALWCARAASKGTPNAPHLLEELNEFRHRGAANQEHKTSASSASESCAEDFVYSAEAHRCVSSAMAMSLDFDKALYPEIAQKP